MVLKKLELMGVSYERVVAFGCGEPSICAPSISRRCPFRDCQPICGPGHGAFCACRWQLHHHGEHFRKPLHLRIRVGAHGCRSASRAITPSSMVWSAFRERRWSRPTFAAVRRLCSLVLWRRARPRCSAIHHINRGYERFVDKLTGLGAQVERASIPDPLED